MAGVIAYTRHALDHDRDARQGPEIGAETMRTRPFSQRELDAFSLLRIKLGRTARPFCSAQRITPALAPLRVPATDALATHSQQPRHVSHDLARSEQLASAASSLLQSLKVPPSTRPHAGIIHDLLTCVTLFYEVQ